MKLLILFCAFWINFSSFGFVRSGGVLFVEFMRQFNCSYQEASWPVVLKASVASFMIGISAFLSHYLEKRLIILIGILTCSISIGLSCFTSKIEWIIFSGFAQGVGAGMFVGLLPIIISENYDKGKSIACGIAYSGCTLAAFIFPPLVQFILTNYNLKIALLVLSLISFSGLLTVWPLKSKKQIIEKKKIGFKNLLLDDIKVLKSYSFWLLTLFYVVFVYVFLIIIIVLPNLAMNRGIDKQNSAFLLSIYSIGDFLGRILPGFLHLKNLVTNQTCYLYSMIIMGILFFLLEQYAISFLSFAIISILLGFVSGIQMTLPAVVMTEMIGLEKTTIGFGFCNTISAFVSLSRPYLIDYIKTETGSYNLLLSFSSAICLLSTIPWIIERLRTNNTVKLKQNVKTFSDTA